MDRFYNDPRPYTGPYSVRDRSLTQMGFVSPPEPTIKYKKRKQPGIGFLARFRGQKDHDTPSRKVIVRGWRNWDIRLLLDGSITILSPIKNGAAVLEAERCRHTSHCGPSCKPPCRECECGVYLRYEPPSFDEIRTNLMTVNAHIYSDPDQQSMGQIWFSCEALGKVIYGDLGARAERVQPLFGIVPLTDDDTFRKLKLYLPAFFGPQLQLLRLEKEEIENLKWGEVWEE